MKASKGHLFIISAPSGAGKTTLVERMRSRFPSLEYSISYTTRALRGEEKEGREYHFITPEEFENGIQKGEWAEWANVYGNYYGTNAKKLNEWLEKGRDVLLDIDVQGFLQLHEKFPEAISIFILPPSLEILKERLIRRNTDSMEVIEKRLGIAQKELMEKNKYSYQIVNDDLDVATEELANIFKTYMNEGSV